MIINGIIFNAELSDIIGELKAQLALNHINLLARTRETPTDIMVACPYHKGGQESRPSAGIRKSDGQFHCLACGETHSLQEMITFCFGHFDDFIGGFGWTWLLKNFLTVSVESRKDIDLNFSREICTKTAPYVSESELDSYRYTHPYMKKRKMSDEMISLFDIGYDKTTKCITFPVRDISGGVLFVARRSTVTKYFNYPAQAEKPVYGLYEYMQATNCPNPKDVFGVDFTAWDKDSVIICESMIDAITSWVYGKFAVALNGLGTELQFAQLNSMHCRKFILATDADKAGMRARKRIKEHLTGKLVTEYLWDLSKAKDINDMEESMFNSLNETFC